MSEPAMPPVSYAVFAHLNVDKTPLYRAILNFFVAERARFVKTPTQRIHRRASRIVSLFGEERGLKFLLGLIRHFGPASPAPKSRRHQSSFSSLGRPQFCVAAPACP